MPPFNADSHVAVEASSSSDQAAPAFGTKATPAQLEVDYDVDMTNVYKAITSEDWDGALAALRAEPSEARTWVVRRADDGSIMWRFLPLHSACARQPPAAIVSALLGSYGMAASISDDQGLHALHYAAGNQASAEVVACLLAANPGAAREQDPGELLPLHYMAKWGPADAEAFDVLLGASAAVVNHISEEGETALDMAREGDYDGNLRDAVASRLAEAAAAPAPPEEVEDRTMVPTEASSGPAGYSVDELPTSSLKKLRAELADLKAQRITLKNETIILKKEKKDLREAADEDFRSSKAAHEKEIKALKLAHDKEMNDLQIEADAQNISQKAQFQGTTSSLREQLKASEKRVSELEQETGTKEDFTQFMEVRLAKKEGDNMSLRETVATLEKEVDELRDAKAELEEAKASLADLQTKAAEATAVHQKIAAAYEKREALLREANEMRQEKMQALINLEVELTQLAANDQEEGNAAYLSTAMDKQQIDLDAMIDTADRGPEEEMEPQPDAE